MLPIILLFLLVQCLFATEEFGSLMQRITFNWNTVDITSKIDGKQTVSTDGEVSNFVFCGAFENSGRDGTCTYTYDYCNDYASFRTSDRGAGSASTLARLISTKNSTYKCYSVNNLIPDFVNIHTQDTRSCPLKYLLKYTCTENKAPEVPFIPDLKNVSIVVMVLLVIVGFGTFTVGKKRGMDSAVGNPSADNRTSSSFANPLYGRPSEKTA